MKRISASLVIVLFAVSLVHAQQSMRFKMHYNPETRYRQMQRQVMSIDIKFSGSQETMDAMKEGGQDTVVHTKNETEMELDLETGVVNKSGIYPIVMEFTRLKSSGEQKLRAGTKFFGHVKPGALPVYDSISGTDFSKEEASQLVSMVSGMLSQIQFPDKELKPGDEFRMETPLALPIGNDAAIKMNVVSTYKLQSIKDGIGYLDFSAEYVATSQVQEMEFPFKGTGAGKMEVDVANNLLRYSLTTTDMTMDTESEGITMNMKMHMEVTMNMSIVKK